MWHMLHLSNLIYSVAWSDKISTGLWLSHSHSLEPSLSRTWLQSTLVVTLGAADSLCCVSHNVFTLQYNNMLTYAYPLTLLISWDPNRLLFFISQVILAIFVAYVVSIILTYTNVFPNDKNHIYYKARTDSRISVLTNAEWFRVPYPGESNCNHKLSILISCYRNRSRLTVHIGKMIPCHHLYHGRWDILPALT